MSTILSNLAKTKDQSLQQVSKEHQSALIPLVESIGDTKAPYSIIEWQNINVGILPDNIQQQYSI